MLGTWCLALWAAGCAPRQRLPVRPHPELLPAGSPLLSRSLDERDAWLRHYLMTEEHATAVDALGRGSSLAPRDRLVRALQEAIVLHQAGEHARSNRVLEWAEVEADLRYTRSVSRAVGSLLVNDGVMSYTPTAGELAMVPYYRMLNYLALGDPGGARVEARKAAALLQRVRRDDQERCHEDGLVLYLAGLVLRDGKEPNDALVALRRAEAAFASCGAAHDQPARLAAVDAWGMARSLGVDEVADTLARRYQLRPDSATGAAAGDVLVLVEHGFVAHRAEEALHVPLFPEEVERLERDDSDGVKAVAARISDRLARSLWHGAHWGASPGESPLAQLAAALEGAYVLRLAWPVHHLEASRPAAVRVLVNDSAVTTLRAGDISTVLCSEWDAARPAVLARMVTRGLTKYLLSRGAEKKAEKEGGEVASFVVGRLANLAANRLEQADTRSWSLLPDQVSLARLRLPAGTHRVRIEVTGGQGSPAQVHDLGPVQVEPGRLLVLRRRVWGSERGELPAARVPAAHAARP